MASNNQELEVKYLIADLDTLQSRLIALGARPLGSRTHEVNLRFDTSTGDLWQSLQVLRLRQDDAARLTYKGPGEIVEGVRVRQEIEFTVSDFDSAQALLEALGYTVSMMYEKYRTTYEFEGTHITLDEMPFGHFTEIEGSDPAHIHAVNQRLGLDWEARISEGYVELFERLREYLGFTFRDLSFDNFEDIETPFKDLPLRPADLPLKP